MRQGPGGRRPRGRPNRKQHGGPQRPNSYDSNGPEGRIRGNAHQVYEKYIGLARDALSSGDRISAEAFYQHAEHYFRIVNGSTDPDPNGRRAADGNRVNGQGDRNGATVAVETGRDASPAGAEQTENGAGTGPASDKREDGESAEAADAGRADSRSKAANGEGQRAPANPRRRPRQRNPRAADQDASQSGESSEPSPAPRQDGDRAADTEATGT